MLSPPHKKQHGPNRQQVDNYIREERAAGWIIGPIPRALARFFLAKFDLRSVYCVVPIHPEDQCLLGVRWQDQVFLNTALPFCLRSAPKIFSALVDALAWPILNSGVRNFHHCCGKPQHEQVFSGLGKGFGGVLNLGGTGGTRKD